MVVGSAQNAIWCIVCQVTGYFVCLHSRCWKQHCPLFASLHSQCHCLVTSLLQPTGIHPKSQLKHASLFLNYAEDYDIESVNQQIHSGTRWQRMREWHQRENKNIQKESSLLYLQSAAMGRDAACVCVSLLLPPLSWQPGRYRASLLLHFSYTHKPTSNDWSSDRHRRVHEHTTFFKVILMPK